MKPFTPTKSSSRTSLVSVCCCVILVLVLAGCSRVDCDFLITDVRYLRGDTFTPEEYQVGVNNGRISYIGKAPIRAKLSISGKGLLLTPGLVDVNSCGWLTEAAAELKLKDGITTYFNAHGDTFEANAEKNHASTRLNYATSVGLIPVQAKGLKGKGMIEALEQSLRYGAYTITLSPEYNALTTREIVRELSQTFGGKNVPFTFHLRYSSEAEELQGLEEALECAAEGNPVHILHITSTGATFHPEEAKRRIDKAISSGMRVTYDFYPYTSWASSIHGARFDGEWISRYKVDFTKVFLPIEGQISQRRFDELRTDPARRNLIVESIPKATVDFFALQTSCPIGTDSAGDAATAHPRGAGSFTKFIGDYVNTGKMPLGKAMHRFSTLVCQQFEPYIPDLKGRGSIEAGKMADLVLWDPPKIRSAADYSNPHKASSGVVAVFVNGHAAVLGGSFLTNSAPGGAHLKGNWKK